MNALLSISEMVLLDQFLCKVDGVVYHVYSMF